MTLDSIRNSCDVFYHLLYTNRDLGTDQIMEAVRTKKAQKSSLVATLGELNQEQVSQNSILWLESSLILALFIVGGKRQGHPGSPEDDWGSEPGK